MKSLFTTQTATVSHTLDASYKISLLIAKSEKNHTIGEDLIKPSISAFVKTVLKKDDKDVKAMPLSNNTVRKRIDKVNQDTEIQLVEKLKSKKFLIQMDKSTVSDSLLAYVRYIDKEKFAKKMLFCESLETTTTATDIYNKLKHYLDVKNITMENITSCAADSAPVMMGKKNGCLKLMKDENLDVLLVRCVIHRENLVAKIIFSELNAVLESVMKCINAIKANAKCECVFKRFCKDNNADHVKLLLHAEVR